MDWGFLDYELRADSRWTADGCGRRVAGCGVRRRAAPLTTAIRAFVVPPWYRLLRPMRPDRRERWTHRTFWTLVDGSTRTARRLGAERSLVQIQSPRSGGQRVSVTGRRAR